MRSIATVALLLSLLPVAACGDDGGNTGDDGSADDDDGAAGSVGGDADDPGARPRPDEDNGDGDVSGDADASGDGDGDGGDGGGRLPLPCDVAGVLEGNCIRCHAERPQQGAPMSLLSWQDLTATNDDGRPIYELVIERVLSTVRPMPPPPNPVLGAAQIDAIERWAADGAEPGDNDACLLPR